MLVNESHAKRQTSTRQTNLTKITEETEMGIFHRFLDLHFQKKERNRRMGKLNSLVGRVVGVLILIYIHSLGQKEPF